MDICKTLCLCVFVVKKRFNHPESFWGTEKIIKFVRLEWDEKRNKIKWF